MPAHNALVGGLKPPQRNKIRKNGVIMPFLGNFRVYFLNLLWALAHILIIFNILFHYLYLLSLFFLPILG